MVTFEFVFGKVLECSELRSMICEVLGRKNVESKADDGALACELFNGREDFI